jgi:HD-like signal output (HDOD) protein
MSSTKEYASGKCVFPHNAENLVRRAYAIAGEDLPSSSGILGELDSLFCAQPVDLKRVSEAVRARPDLEALVLRLTDSLELSPDVPIATVEEAAVVLGRDRLRVLLHTWALAQR